MPTDPTLAQMRAWLESEKYGTRYTGVSEAARATNAMLDAILAALGETGEDLCDDGGCREHAYQEYLRGKAEGRPDTALLDRVKREIGNLDAARKKRHEGSSVGGWYALTGNGYIVAQISEDDVLSLAYAAAPRPTEETDDASL